MIASNNFRRGKKNLSEEEEEEEEEEESAMMEADEGFRTLDEDAIVEYIKATPALMARLGNQWEGLKIKEIGDGNVNYVYTVVGHHGSFVLKQAPPYMRCLGESWPMSPKRAYFEALALKELGRLCPNHVPKVYHFDKTMSLLAMRYIEPPHIVLRKGLIAEIEYPLLAEHVSEYLAKTLYFTSLLFHSTSVHKHSVAEFIGNIDPCMVSEQFYFSESYKDSPQYIRWTSPYLDNDVEAARQDDSLKLEIAELKSMFCERAQALIHGDLHTSAVMVTPNSTQVIDPEFAFYGPMGYDIGTFVAHLIIAFFAQDGLANQENDRKKYKQWILTTIEETWNLFEKKFVLLWNENKDGNGEAYLPAIYNTPELWILVQKKYMKDLLCDSLGFGAAKLIRITMTVAPVEDFESITDASKRACCERHALNLGKLLLKERHRFDSIGQVISAIQDISSI